MANKIIHKKSSVASRVPVPADLEYGELALNYTDGRIFYKHSDTTIHDFTDHGGLAGLTDVGDHPQYQMLHGVPYNVDTGYAFALSYDPSTRKATLTPSGASFDIWTRGVKHTFTGAQVTDAHANTTGSWYLTCSSAGALEWNVGTWDILGPESPILYVYYESGAGVAIWAIEERHTAERNPETHYRLHFGEGSVLSSTPGLPTFGNYVPATDTVAATQWSATSVTVLDEDIEVATGVLAAGGPYRVLYRSGATGPWLVQSTLYGAGGADSCPFLTNGTELCWNEWTGATWQKTAVGVTGTAQYVNMWLFATTDLTAANRYFIIPGQQKHATLALAQADNPGTILFGTSPTEYVAIARMTWECKNSYSTNTDKTALVEIVVTYRSKGSFTSGAGVTNHTALSNIGINTHDQIDTFIKYSRAKTFAFMGA